MSATFRDAPFLYKTLTPLPKLKKCFRKSPSPQSKFTRSTKIGGEGGGMCHKVLTNILKQITLITLTTLAGIAFLRLNKFICILLI